MTEINEKSKLDTNQTIDNFNNNSNNLNNPLIITNNEDSVETPKIKEIKNDANDYLDGEIPTKKIVIDILAICIPSALNFFALFFQQTLNIVFISKGIKDETLQAEAISGIGISNLYLNVTLLSIAVGLLNGFNVLGSNAYGKGKFYLFGLYFQRCLLVSYLFSIVIIIIHFFTIDKGMALLGAKGKSLEYANSYAKVSMFFVLFEILFNSAFRYLNMAKMGYIVVIVLVITTAIHPLWCYLFIVVADLGTTGAAISLVLSQFLTGTSLFLFIIIKKPIDNTVFCLNKDSFKSWGSYLSIAVPAALLLCFEWWAFEVQQVIVANCGRVDWEIQLSTQVISANLWTLAYTFGLGINFAVSILSSKFLATNKIEDTKRCYKYCLYVTFIIYVPLTLIMFFTGEYLYGAFTSNKEVINEGKKVIVYLAPTVFFTGLKCCLQGMLIGQRKHLLASSIAFFSYYVLMVSLSIVLTIVLQYGDTGVWIAEVAGYVFICIVFVFIILRVDMDKVVEEVKKKLQADQLAISKKNEEDEAESVYAKDNQNDDKRKNNYKQHTESFISQLTATQITDYQIDDKFNDNNNQYESEKIKQKTNK